MTTSHPLPGRWREGGRGGEDEKWGRERKGDGEKGGERDDENDGRERRGGRRMHRLQRPEATPTHTHYRVGLLYNLTTLFTCDIVSAASPEAMD